MKNSIIEDGSDNAAEGSNSGKFLVEFDTGKEQASAWGATPGEAADAAWEALQDKDYDLDCTAYLWDAGYLPARASSGHAPKTYALTAGW